MKAVGLDDFTLSHISFSFIGNGKETIEYKLAIFVCYLRQFISHFLDFYMMWHLCELKITNNTACYNFLRVIFEIALPYVVIITLLLLVYALSITWQFAALLLQSPICWPWKKNPLALKNNLLVLILHGTQWVFLFLESCCTRLLNVFDSPIMHLSRTDDTYLLTYLLTYLTYLLTPWCGVLLEKLTGLQLVKKFPAFHGTWKFITTLTSVTYFLKFNICNMWSTLCETPSMKNMH